MEETYNIQAIVLDRCPFREADLRIEVFSPERGKLELIARGAKKINSKLAGHIEPFNFSKLMIVRGKQLNYVGGADNKNCFANIKNDVVKSVCAAKGLKFFNQFIKAEETEEAENIFLVLSGFLTALGDSYKNYDLILEIFKFRILFFLGYSIEVDKCFICKKTLNQKEVYFSRVNRGFLCSQCVSNKDLLINEELIEIINNKKNYFYFAKGDKKTLDALKKINQSLIFDL